MKKSNEAYHLIKIVMRISLAVCIISVLSLNMVQATVAKGQSGLDKSIHLNLKNVSFADLLKEIENKTGISFVYTNQEVISTRISVNNESVTARSIIIPVLTKNNLVIIEDGATVVFKRGRFVADAKHGSIVGYVKDNASNQTLPYATVLVKGTSRKLITDANGYFVISSIKAGTVILQVSYIGYTAAEFSVEVKEDQTVQQELKLDSRNNDMAGITISGIRRGEAIALRQYAQC